MRPVRRLTELRNRALRRVSKLKGLGELCRAPLTPEDERMVAFVTIEACNLWAEFMRTYYLSCAFNAERDGGGVVTVGRLSRCVSLDANGALVAAAVALKRERRYSGALRRTEEPNWVQVHTIVALADRMEFSNQSAISSALSFGAVSFDHWPTMRNFFAHRSGDSALRAKNVGRQIGVGAVHHPSEIMVAFLRGRPQSVLCDWLDEVRIGVELMCR